MNRKKVSFPSLREEKRILDAFDRASLKSKWWKANRIQPKYCLRCGSSLRRAYVLAEKCSRLVCQTCNFISYENPKVVAATLPARDGKIYLLRRDIEPSRGLWTFPAGYMEIGETVSQAAIRETREEIRCHVEIENLQGIYSYPDSSVVTVVYDARVVGRKPSAGHETQCVKAFLPSEIPWKTLAFRSTFCALREWVRKNQK